MSKSIEVKQDEPDIAELTLQLDQLRGSLLVLATAMDAKVHEIPASAAYACFNQAANCLTLANAIEQKLLGGLRQ